MTFVLCCAQPCDNSTVVLEEKEDQQPHPYTVRRVGDEIGEDEDALDAAQGGGSNEELAGPAEEPQRQPAPAPDEVSEPAPGDEFSVDVDRGEELRPVGLVLYQGMKELAGVIVSVRDGPLSKTPVRAGDRVLAVNGKDVEVAELHRQMTASRVLDLRLKRPKKYTVNVNKGDKLGLSLQFTGSEHFLMIQDILEGAIQDLNKRYTDREVRILDCIIGVNSLQECSADVMLKEIAAAQTLSLTLFRWYSRLEVDKILATRRSQEVS